ncbi:DMT family transporter [Deinococcus pimensis]|uniref:DMT family transporter n=1 Tax=Deinococcus pimensis TaxID=309888 RepID=UPI0006942627|nr:DMT family transporter [Deinococcus pimensis]
MQSVLLGVLAVLAFSLTFPATRAAVPELGSIIVGLGRTPVAALLAALILLAHRKAPPARRHLGRILAVTVGVVIGYPLLTTIALRHVPATHAAVVVGLLPAATAMFAVLTGGERLPRRFWLCALAGVLVVTFFALSQGVRSLQSADLLLLAAVLLSAYGTVQGTRVAREIGAWQVMCWALVIATPFLLLPVGVEVARHGLHASVTAWLAFGYVSMVSMLLAFLAWYRSLALGGTARGAQLQMAQPMLALIWAYLLLGEHLSVWTVVTCVAVVALAAAARLSSSARPPAGTTDATGTAKPNRTSAHTTRR